MARRLAKESPQEAAKRQPQIDARIAEWREYIDGGRCDDELLNRLLLTYIGHVKKLAVQVANQMRAVQADDLIQEGFFGLVSAAKKYDPDKDVAFWNFACLRVRGAMIDSLRRDDPVSRQRRRRQKQRDRFSADFEQRLHRPPNEQEIAEHFGWDDRKIQQSRPAATYSMEEKVPGSPESRGRATTIGDTIATSVDGPVVKFQQQEDLREAFSDLSLREQTMIYLYVAEDVPQRVIAQLFGVSVGRITQMMAAVRERLLSQRRSDQLHS